jgi:hypothetical protein
MLTRVNPQSNWRRWILREKQVTATTWKFRLLVLLAALAVACLTYPSWLVAIGSGLLHEQKLEPADVILLENFDTDYAVFETAQRLVEAGYASRVLVPVRARNGQAQIALVEKGIAEVMSRVAGIEQCEILPVQHIEPVSLNVAHQIAQFLESEGIRSVLVVSPGFRSSRSYLVYDHVFTPRGIRVECTAAHTDDSGAFTWWHTWHGVQDTVLELGKLLYYRVWVLQRFDRGPNEPFIPLAEPESVVLR